MVPLKDTLSVAKFCLRVLAILIYSASSVHAQSLVHQFSLNGGGSEPAIGAKFGWSLAVANDRVAIGSPHYNDQYGRVAYHALDGQGGSELLSYCRDNLVNGSGTNPIQQRFGASVATDGDWVVVGNCSPFGTTQYCNDQADRVLVYQYVGDTLQGYQSITSPAAGGSFGKAIALEGDLVVIGGARSYVNGGWRDVVYLYQRSGALWPTQPTDSLVVSDALGTESFGHALALKNGVLLVGASADSELATGCGAAYLFGREENGTDAWELIRKLLPSNGLAGDEFGTAVALSGERCVVGAPDRSVDGVHAGAAYVFDRDQGFPGNWGEVAYLEPIGEPVANMDHGASVAIGPDRIAIGAPQHAISASGTDGSVHVHERVAGEWAPMQRIVPYFDGVINAVGRAGTSLAFHQGQLLIGAPWAIDLGQTPPSPVPTGVVLVYDEGVVGLAEQAQSRFQLWPNPVADRLFFSGASGTVANLRVYDMQGRQLVHDRVDPRAGSVDVIGLDSGSYFVVLEGPDGDRVIRPFIRE